MTVLQGGLALASKMNYISYADLSLHTSDQRKAKLLGRFLRNRHHVAEQILGKSDDLQFRLSVGHFVIPHDKRASIISKTGAAAGNTSFDAFTKPCMDVISFVLFHMRFLSVSFVISPASLLSCCHF